MALTTQERSRAGMVGYWHRRARLAEKALESRPTWDEVHALREAEAQSRRRYEAIRDDSLPARDLLRDAVRHLRRHHPKDSLAACDVIRDIEALIGPVEGEC